MEKMNVKETENKVVEKEILSQYMETRCSNCKRWDPNYSGGYCEYYERVQHSDGWCHNWK